MALLAETRDGLKEILKTNQDILEELDQLEEKQRQRREKILKSRSQGDASPTEEEAGKSGSSVETSEHTMTPGQHQPEHSGDTGRPSAKKEATFQLKPEMKEYSRWLKHCVTPEHQDNRMCEKFNIQPHRGALDRRQAGQTDGRKKVQHLAIPAKPRAEGQRRTQSQDSGTQPTQVMVKQDASPSLPDQLATMLDPAKLMQMGGLQQMMSGWTMAMNPTNGMIQVIQQGEIESMKEQAEAAGQPVIIMTHELQAGCMKLVSGREYLQDLSSMLTEENLAELDKPERDLLLANNKVLSLFTNSDSVPYVTYMQAYMGALQLEGIQEQLVTGAQAVMEALLNPSKAVPMLELPGSQATQQTTQHKALPPSSGSQKSKSSSSTFSSHKSKPSSAATKSHHSKSSSSSTRDQQQSRSSDKDRKSSSHRTKPSSSLTSPNVTPQRPDTQSSQHKPSTSQSTGKTQASSQGKGTSSGTQQSQGAKSETSQSQSQAGAGSDTQKSGGGVSSQSRPAISHVSPVMGLQQSAGQVRADFVRTGGQVPATEKEVEPVYIDESMWSDVANQQVAEGARARSIRERGMDTIICLDLSESMKGEPWKEAMAFIQGFIEGIQNTTLMDDAYEHVGLVTFGSETRVQQHMTCDYVEVTRKLGKLSPGGPSPLWAGITMLYAAMNGSGATFCTNGYKIQPRVFLLTDCQPTASNMIAGPDRCLKGEQALEKFKVVELVAKLHKTISFTLNLVPVGDFDSDLCAKLSSMTGGKVVMPSDWKTVTRTFRNYLSATKLGPLLKMGSPELAHLWLDALGGGSSQEDKTEMEEFLKNHKQDATEDSSDSEDLPEFPSLGSRVKKNPIAYRTDMPHRVGTVTKHMHDGHIGVTWDEADEEGKIREKVEYSDSTKVVLPCDQPRRLKDEMIAVGCRVRRGKDWRYTDQDGGDGKLGSVFSVQPSGIIRVRWDCGHKNTYRFGEDGIYFDVEVVEVARNPDQREEKEKEPFDLIEEMNRKNAARSQNIMDSIAPGTRSPSRGYASDTETISAARKNKTDGVTRAMTPDTHSGQADAPVASARTVASGRGGREERKADDSDKADAPVAGARTVASGRGGKEERKAGDTVVATSKTVTGAGGADNGARPKAVLTPEEIKWRWNNNGVWEVYPPEVCGKIETSFRRNPRGTALIQVGNTQFRVVFSRMEQLNVQTRDKYPVCRE